MTTVILRSPILRGGFSAGATLAIPATGASGSSSGIVGYQRLPGEALYNVNFTLQNIVAGSIAIIKTLADAEITRANAIGGDTVLSVPFFGSNQTVKVIVRKATAPPFYQSYETQAVITSTGPSLYVNQLSDEI